MTAKKKPNPGASETNASAEAPPSNDNTLAPNDNEDHGEDFEVKDLADGDFEVDLHDLGISAEDIQVMKKIDAHLSERLRQAQQAQAERQMRRWQQERREKGMSSPPKS